MSLRESIQWKEAKRGCFPSMLLPRESDGNEFKNTVQFLKSENSIIFRPCVVPL